MVAYIYEKPKHFALCPAICAIIQQLQPSRTKNETKNRWNGVFVVHSVHGIGYRLNWNSRVRPFFQPLLPSNLRQTTRECMCLVRRGDFRSRDKDGRYTIWSAIAENPLLHANFMTLSSIEPELLPIKVWLARIEIFVQCFVLLWPWPWPDDLHIRTWPVFPRDISADQKQTFCVKAFKSYCITCRHRPVYIQTNIAYRAYVFETICYCSASPRTRSALSNNGCNSNNSNRRACNLFLPSERSRSLWIPLCTLYEYHAVLWMWRCVPPLLCMSSHCISLWMNLCWSLLPVLLEWYNVGLSHICLLLYLCFIFVLYLCFSVRISANKLLLLLLLDLTGHLSVI